MFARGDAGLWEETAKERQQVYYEVFGDRDWDVYKGTELQYFQRNIGHAIYGPPDEEPNETTNLCTGYSLDKLKHIKQICDTIKQQDVHIEKVDDEIRVSIIYVIMKFKIDDFLHIPSPLFRVPKQGDSDNTSNIFIDSNCRVYVGWLNYLKNNQLPRCTYCYPRNGVYIGDSTDHVIVDISETPAGSLTNRILNGADTFGTAVSAGVTLVTLAAFAVPVAAPVMLATTLGGAVVGVYGAGRSVESIVDRKKHQQSIGIKDAGSRNSWILLIGNSLGLAAAGASKTVSVMASRGSVVGKTGCFVVNATQISSIAVNGIGIVNGFFVLRERSKTGDLTCLEVFQFSSSILFFTNSVVNLKTAKTIIRETQQNVIQEFEANLRSNRHRKAYQRLARNTREGLDAMNGDAKVIKSIMNINNPDEFFSGIVRVQKQFTQNEAQMSFTENGHVDINKHIQVDPSKFASMDKGQRQIILDASKQFAEGTLNKSQYESTVNPVYLQHGLETSHQRVEALSQVCPNSVAIAHNLMEVDIGGKRIFANLQPSDMARVVAVVRKCLSADILYVAVQLAQALKFYKTADFIKFLEFSSGFIDQILSEMEYAYFEMLSGARYRPDFNQSQFDQEYGIQGDRRQHFLNGIYKIYSIGQKCLHMRDAYERYKTTVSQLEQPQSTNNLNGNELEQAGTSTGRTGRENLSIRSSSMEHSGLEPPSNRISSNDLSSAWAQLQLPGIQLSTNDNRFQNSGNSTETNDNLSTAWEQSQLPVAAPNSNQTHVKLSRTWEDMDLSESISSPDVSNGAAKHFRPSPSETPSSSAKIILDPTAASATYSTSDVTAASATNSTSDVTAVSATNSTSEVAAASSTNSSSDSMCTSSTNSTAEAAEETHLPQLRIDRDFSLSGLLSIEDHFGIAQILTGVEANKYNAYVEQYDDLMALVVIMHEVDPKRVVLITSDIQEKVVTANELV